MDCVKELLKPKTMNRLSYVAVFCWVVIGVILLGIFADIENSESRFDFRCGTKRQKIQNVDLVRAKCFEQYRNLYNKSSFPVFAFVILNFSLITLFCVIYSQLVTSRVDRLLDHERQRLPKSYFLFKAYCCQLAARFVFGIIFIVLQTQLLYPSNFPTSFDCTEPPGTAGSSRTANASTGNIQNSTVYECINQRAKNKTFWTIAVSVVNGVFALIILIEIIWIFSRSRRGKKSLEDLQFLADHLNSNYEAPQQEQEQEVRQQEENEESSTLLPELPQESELPQQEQEQENRQQEENEESSTLLPELPQESELPQQEQEQENRQQEENEESSTLLPELPQESELPQQEQEQENRQQEENEEFSLLVVVPQEFELSAQLRSFIENLKKNIIENTEKPTDLKPLFQPNHGEGERIEDLKLDSIYTNLVLIPNRAKYDFSGNRQKQLKVYPKPSKNIQTPKGPEDIVDVDNKNILIVGRPGIGKTLFCTKFIRDWASGRVFNKTQDTELFFDFAFLVKFRKFNSVETLNLRELLSWSEYSQTECLADEVWNYILENPEKVLILFDGMDELVHYSKIAEETVTNNYKNKVEEKMPLAALFSKIVNGKILRGAAIVTTTRPTAVSCVGEVQFIKRTIEILGFAKDQVEEYVENFTKDAAENLSGAGEKIWQHISTSMNLFSLCYIPVNCFIICSCLLQILVYFKECGKNLTSVGLPTKLTQIYKKAVKLFFFKHNEQYRDKPLTREEILSDNLPPEVEGKFKRLGKVAFNGIKERRLIFGSSEVQGLENCALFYKMRDRQIGPFEYEAQFCFMHLTMQEFLAAKHITDTMNEVELRIFVSDIIKKGEWQVVLQFVAGLLGERDDQSIEIFTSLLPVETEKRRDETTRWPTNSDKHLALTIIKCLHEGSKLDLIHPLLQNRLDKIINCNVVDFSVCGITPADCTALVHLLKNFQQISCIELDDNHIGSLGCVEIKKLLHSDNSQLTYLDLMNNGIGNEGLVHLSEGIKTSKLTKLYLSYNKIGNEGLDRLREGIKTSKLTMLDLTGNQDITDEAIVRFQEDNPNCLVRFLFDLYEKVYCLSPHF